MDKRLRFMTRLLDDGKMAGVHPVYVAPHDQDWLSDG
jgi:hypothetical protein